MPTAPSRRCARTWPGWPATSSTKPPERRQPGASEPPLASGPFPPSWPEPSLRGYLVAEPGQRHRVPVVDGHVAGLEKLEPDRLGGDTRRPQRGVHRLGADIEEPLVPDARVDPNGPHPPERTRVLRDHPDRVPVQPALPDLGPDHPGPGVARQLHLAVRV